MKQKAKKSLVTGMVWLAAFVVLTIGVQTVDVKPIGQNGTDIGFAALNTAFFELFGVHMRLYTVTDWLGLVPLSVCMIFGAVGLVQLIKRKSLFRVDWDILLLGVYYILVIFGYLFFETVPINYRPIPIDGRMEASYPSSTTLLVLSVMPTLVFEVKQRIRNAAARNGIIGVSVAFSAFLVIGRLVSGVHWFTDIVGGMLLSFGLYYLYKGAARMCTRVQY